MATNAMARDLATLGDSLHRIVAKSGGIDPASMDFLKHYSNAKAAVENGIPFGVFKKGGRNLEELAYDRLGPTVPKEDVHAVGEQLRASPDRESGNLRTLSAEHEPTAVDRLTKFRPDLEPFDLGAKLDAAVKRHANDADVDPAVLKRAMSPRRDRHRQGQSEEARRSCMEGRGGVGERRPRGRLQASDSRCRPAMRRDEVQQIDPTAALGAEEPPAPATLRERRHVNRQGVLDERLGPPRAGEVPNRDGVGRSEAAGRGCRLRAEANIGPGRRRSLSDVAGLVDRTEQVVRHRSVGDLRAGDLAVPVLVVQQTVGRAGVHRQEQIHDGKLDPVC